MQEGVLPGGLLQVSYHRHRTDRRLPTSATTAFLRQDAFLFAWVTGAVHDDFGEHFAGVRYEGDASIVTTLRPLFYIVHHLDRGILPLLRYTRSLPYSFDGLA